MKKVLAILLLSASAFASIGKVASFPIRHPKKSAHKVKVAAQKSGHVAKKILY
jgi:hypothetical protein